jgi:hypothetical protein
MHTKYFVENLKGRDQLGDLGIEGRIALKHLKRQVVRVLSELNWPGIRSGGEFLEHSN